MNNNYDQFSGSRAIILGGSSGSGFAAEKKLATHGVNIATLYRETAIREKPLKKEFAVIAQDHGVLIATTSLKKIPGSDKLIKHADENNPLGRITGPADAANVIYPLCIKEAAWINGSLIHVDGGGHCR